MGNSIFHLLQSENTGGHILLGMQLKEFVCLFIWTGPEKIEIEK